MPEARYGSLPFQESIDFFRSKLNIPTERWADVWAAGHNNGFMIAGAMKDDLLNDMRKMVDSAIAEGKSIGWLKTNFKQIRAKHGWEHTGSSAWRSRIIYDTNMRQSYNAGRYEQLQHFAYWEYQHGDSIHPRPMHLSWHSLLLPKSDEWWQTHFPQNGWGCKCKVRGRSQAYVNRKNLKISKAPNDGTKAWVDKVTGEEHVIPKGIDPSFDYAPQKQTINKNLAQQAKKKAETFTPPPRIAPTAFSSVPGADVHSLNKKLAEFTPAKERLNQLGQFLDKHDIKTLFLKQAQMGAKTKASRNLAPQVQPYLNMGSATHSYFTTRNASRTNGFTWRNKNHVVVKVKSDTRFNKVQFDDLAEAVENAILLMREGNKQWSLSHIVRTASESGDNGGALVTWLHEIGHQVHYKAGKPRMPVPYGHGVTQYSLSNDFEWHAEHFAMWLLNRDALAKWDEGIAVYFDKLLEAAF
jgi:hypothetical protein